MKRYPSLILALFVPLGLAVAADENSPGARHASGEDKTLTVESSVPAVAAAGGKTDSEAAKIEEFFTDHSFDEMASVPAKNSEIKGDARVQFRVWGKKYGEKAVNTTHVNMSGTPLIAVSEETDAGRGLAIFSKDGKLLAMAKSLKFEEYRWEPVPKLDEPKK